MARKGSWNPIAFVPVQVTVISSIIYTALFAVLIVVHSTVPSAPSDSTPIQGINLTKAWLDLDFVSDGYHPIDSKRNGVVRQYLVQRIEETLKESGIEYKTVISGVRDEYAETNETDSKAVTVFQDNLSNVTFVDDFRQEPWTCYSESENLMVYLRGEEDNTGDWWNDENKYKGHGGVLVNAHYDSVSSGYGATDDGVGVITLLQLLSYFTQDGKQPRRGIVFLFNNGEENGLYGAHNFLRHPLSQFTHTFLNLEGAGAGGRATLFRSTDAEVTRFYASSPRPFGSVVSGDGFKRGFIRSGTDYTVLNGDNGMRGLDVAFYKPRSRYHTDQDNARETDPNSIWHMLSTSLETVKAMANFEGDEFQGAPDRKGKLNIGTGSNGVWFDLFGRSFALMPLPTLFALSVMLLAAGPIILIVLEIILRRRDKWYLLAKRQYIHSSDDDQAVHFSGMRGLFRFPIAFSAATAAVLALAYLLTKVNPFIIYSSEYTVFAMLLSIWFGVAWFFLAGADRMRPTAFQRMFNLIWLYALSWVILVGVTFGENTLKVASGYFMVVYNASIFVALLISYIELFALPTKKQYVEHVGSADEAIEHGPARRESQSSRSLLAPGGSRTRPSRGSDNDEATENTSLLRGAERQGGNTFSGLNKRRHPDNDGTLEDTDDPYLIKAYGEEQAWSSSLPSWTWIIQLLILVPINVILVGQVALLLVAALHQTPADGNPVLPIYLFLCAFTILLLLPLTPFLHRFSYQVSTLLFLVFAGCLIYNLFAYPFSREARLKVYFVQQVDLHSGINNVTLTGLDGYVQNIIEQLPSSSGHLINCGSQVGDSFRKGLTSCQWNGLAPNVLANSNIFKSSGNSSDAEPYDTWLQYNVTMNDTYAAFSFQGRNTKSCRLLFDNPVSTVSIEDAASDPRYNSVADEGSSQVRLFSRNWDEVFKVNVTWSEQGARNRTGKVMCLWSDVNQLGTIPAYDELLRFQPIWSAATKSSDGLVEGWKAFNLS